MVDWWHAPGVRVPPVGWEVHRWRPRAEFEGYHSRAEITRQTGEYRSAVPAAIAGWTPTFGAELAADVDDATRAIERFDAHAGFRLGTGDPLLGPMAAILLRTESASSSQIEQLTASAQQLALAELGEGARGNAELVVGNVRAMEAAIRLADRLDAEAILELHRALTSAQPSMGDDAGRMRRELVWIGPGSAGPLLADYVAPQPDLVPDAVEDLVAFIRRDDLPPLVQVAVAHAQFETIHPFVDGNGRAGRALAHAMMRAKRIATNQTVPISAGLLSDTEGYFEALVAYRDGDAEPIIRRFAAAARFAAVTGHELVDDLADVIERDRKRLAGLRGHAAAWRLLPHLIGQPVVNLAYARRVLGSNDVTAWRAIGALEDRGVIVERTGRSTDRMWRHERVLAVLDRYAARIRRRAPSG